MTHFVEKKTGRVYYIFGIPEVDWEEGRVDHDDSRVLHAVEWKGVAFYHI